MGLRETVNKNAALFGIAAVVIAGVALFYGVRSAMRAGRPAIPNAGYYTVDEGKTWFEDDLNKIPPFDYDGKPAVRAYVYSCEEEGEFTGILERFTPEGKKALEGIIARNETANSAAIAAIYESSVEIKTPGSATWVRRNSPAGQELQVVKCKSGEIPETIRP